MTRAYPGLKGIFTPKLVFWKQENQRAMLSTWVLTITEGPPTEHGHT